MQITENSEMARFRKQPQRNESYRVCWLFLTLISLMMLVVAQSILVLLNSYENTSRVQLMCINNEQYDLLGVDDHSFCRSKERERRHQNNASTLLPVIENDIEPSQLSMRDYIVQRYSSPNDNFDIQKQRDILIANLEYAYTDVQEMLNRQNRFPSIEERVKVYMSNWYIPPCDDSARIPYQYSSNSSEQGDISLAIKELSPVQNEQELLTDDKVIQPDRQQREFILNSRFDLKNDDEALDEVHFTDRYTIMDCDHIYCKDTLSYLLPAFDRFYGDSNAGTIIENSPNVPILFQFGDMFETRATIRYKKANTVRKHIRYPKIPVFQKVRSSKSPSEIQFETDESSSSCYDMGERRTTTKSLGFHFSSPLNALQMEPIIFKVKTFRHYGKIFTGAVVNSDHTSWNEKKDVAIFRGALTGNYNNGMKSKEAFQLTILDRCRILDRCWFAFSHATSKLVDAKLTVPFAPNRRIPSIIEPSGDVDDAKNVSSSNPVDLYGNPMSMEELLEYKALIMLEGNDISSGLKWALFSSSIVMMPEPTLTSWSMEEMLQPWVHYVPINVYRDSNGTTTTDAEEKMQWILDNDDKAREIVKASTLWIADLILHPDESNDEKLILDEIARRYITHFVPSQDLW